MDKESPKKIAAIILAGKPKHEMAEEPESDSSYQEEVGMEILNAIKSKDPQALVEAIKACMEC